MNRTHVLVDVEYLRELEDQAVFLGCLEESGVDNWEGYCEAHRLYLKATEDFE